jgi:hypothetical protein
MKRLILAIFCLFSGQFIVGQTIVNGGIFSNTTWQLSNSPFLMTGNIVVFPGVTLNIEPGVEVRVASDSLSGGGYYLESRGTVNMIGQPGFPIRFRSNQDTTTVGAWQGFRVNNAQGGAINFDYVDISNANSTFTYTSTPPQFISLHGCTFNFNYYGIESSLSLSLDSCSFYGNYSAIGGWSIFNISRCTFDSNGAAMPVYVSDLVIDSCIFTRNNVAVFLNSIPVTGMSITNTTFSDNGSAINNPGNGTVTNCRFENNINGIVDAVNAQISNSYFSNNQQAVQLGFGSSIQDCDIIDNSIGVGLGPLSFGQPVPVVLNNRICNNDSINVENRTDLNLVLSTNCFCESDSALIEAKIYDGYDDITRGLISYAIFDTSCSTVLRLINKFPGTTNISTPSRKDHAFYPNPVSDQLTIENTGDVTLLNVLDALGNNILEFIPASEKTSLSLNSLPSGVYFVRIQYLDGGLRVQRVVKL